jgi:acetyltransferase-like isoleucine patch superfamily enzyme
LRSGTFLMAGRNEEPSNTISFQDFLRDTKAPRLGKYQEIVLGERNLLRLVKYEALTFLLCNMTGLPGLFLRQKLYRSIFGHLGERVIIGAGVSLRQPKNIKIHRSCVIEDLVSLAVRGGGSSEIVLGEGVFVGRAAVIHARAGRIEIDKYTTINSSCRIATENGTVRIGRYVQIAAFCYVGGGDHLAARIDIPMALQGAKTRGGVTIGDDVWLGTHTFVKDGVTIGSGSIIGACSFVNSDIPPYSIAFGCPATVRKQRRANPVGNPAE